YFVFLSAEILSDIQLVNIASADAYHLGVLSSRIHTCWSAKTGGALINVPRYSNSICFGAFPFPDATSKQHTRIRDLGEKIDAHRKARQAMHPNLTLTGMYNVLEALRASRKLADKDIAIYEDGLVHILLELHRSLDAAVADAYGWDVDMSDDEILSRLVELNAERLSEEQQGQIRWLRPEYQSKRERQHGVVLAASSTSSQVTKKPVPKPVAQKAKSTWPTDPLEQIQLVNEAIVFLRAGGTTVTVDAVAARFVRAPRKMVAEILRALATLGLDGVC
ncbi:MAG: DUF3684 domain-containing protein, partial [Polyangiaceae bacterium]|nr:DUF3684 domain-containing protein [Polyangiaceae bacterium]